ncbi:hypothetical protein A2Z22_04770 [Candidatus Woesebacteria bacterium RBG_16_34_12]|uniref:Type I restriction modification DNA specificity domain-containing protein n=1 Tax=Candidatus Woesebacteria bacterium RBG_16_34_12 TaxID=1802480 RepID=A0A1F7XAB4_9BACT|nr:MAG: hypothetical protein A2Z22_04770 [Candidatus Woesebacteria bacterium RBG_16_34_12]
MQNSQTAITNNEEEIKKLSELIEFAIGGDWGKDISFATDEYVPVKVIRGTEFANWNTNKANSAAIRKIKISSLEKRRLRAGDLIVEISGGGPSQPVGRVIHIDMDLVSKSEMPYVCSNFFRLVRLKDTVIPKYVKFALDYQYQSGEVNKYQTSSTNLRNLNFPDYLNGVEIPIYSKEVQQLLSDKLQLHTDTVLIAKEKISKAKLLIQKFRQSVLSAAVTGKLTEGWRGDGQYKTVSLERLTTVIPENWEIISFGEKIKVLTDYHANGSYKTLKEHVELKEKQDYAIMIRTTNFEKNDFEKNLKYISKSAYEFLDKSKVFPEDILMNKIANPGVTYFMPNLGRPVSLAMNLFLIRTVSDVKQQYAYYYLRAKESMVKSFSRGSTTKTIDKHSVRSIPFVLPPIDEQTEIISRIRSLMKIADQTEQQIENAEKRTNKLTQAILGKAFRGELVN